MDLDKTSRDSTPSRSNAAAVDLNKTFIITFDSLGSRHSKVAKTLHEWLWREALDKKRFPPSLLAKQAAKMEAEARARQAEIEAKRMQKRARESAQKVDKDSAGASEHAPMDEKEDGATDTAKVGDKASGIANADGVRKIQVQDTRPPSAEAGAGEGTVATAGSFNAIDEEAIAKSLPETTYIFAKVPSQPNFCDCGIYLLHYVERFFSDPDRFLKFTVEAQIERPRINKAGPNVRRQHKQQEEAEFESRWHAGEVSGKREYWRVRLIELSEAWRKEEKRKRAKEAEAAAMARAAALEQGETQEKKEAPANEQQKPTVEKGDAAQQEFVQRQDEMDMQVEDVLMPQADAMGEVDQAVAAHKNDGERQEATHADAHADAVTTGLTLDANEPRPIGDMEQTLQGLVDGCLQGNDHAGRQHVEEIIAQALADQEGPLTQENVFASQGLQGGDRELERSPATRELEAQLADIKPRPFPQIQRCPLLRKENLLDLPQFLSAPNSKRHRWGLEHRYWRNSRTLGRRCQLR